MRPVNERILPEMVREFSGPMSIPLAIYSYQNLGASIRRDPIPLQDIRLSPNRGPS